MGKPSRFVVIIVAATALGCQRQPESLENTQTAASTVQSIQSLPDQFELGLYSGVLPCASCPGIETRIDFRDDNTFLRRRVYLNGPATEDRTFFDLGRWTAVPGGRLVLRANGGDVTRFSVWAAGEIRLLDERGTAIDSDVDLNLKTESGGFQEFGPAVLKGMYTYFADAAIFAPCNTRVRFPVVMIERHVDLEESYLENRSGPGAPLLVEIVARLEQVPAMEGDGTEEAVVVSEFRVAFPGASCLDEGALTDSTGWVLRELNGVLIERDDP
ncbi:MAG TPA: copper resistance protein NlpE N-terminal domain-containing protein [Rhodothermales bacterium]|nr:copper resistance protein NlpE N-terminal domain-containing protein [Rhodothermales bacterium]